MPSNDVKTFKLEDATLVFRNFAGKEGQFNREGDRNFCAILTPEQADTLAADGWNVKMLSSREEGDPDTPYIKITVGYKVKPPRIVLITSTSRTSLRENQLEVLDWADIAKADLIANSYYWENNGKSGIKAYLKTLFVILEEDELEQKYGVNEVEDGDS